ncbi:phage regulatory CII family protein [Aidingimonas halophila]|uniref:Phage regulatory protein CII (CP76) n=1 Tax=Aidingimonas halophila TaxID=574349 RepID=A0A1H2RFG0_9GAMM|nr:phage regulatory CII family protein [Aidingimonas halophila]GHC19305.1 hypothetical protein GCM10008094_06620 [Aidingimonas halophila]SDW18176.1 hypothetical protein SAMN05443545_101310 [Aidingimonas halophila]
MSKRWPTSLERAQREVLSLNLALYHAARDYPGGVKAVAAVHGLNATTLQHKLSPTHDSHRPNIDDIESVLAVTRDPRIMDSLGEIAGGAIWVIPDDCRADNVTDLLDLMSVLHKRLGEMITSVSESVADGVVDDHERAKLRKRARRMLEAVLALELSASEYGEVQQ